MGKFGSTRTEPAHSPWDVASPAFDRSPQHMTNVVTTISLVENLADPHSEIEFRNLVGLSAQGAADVLLLQRP